MKKIYILIPVIALMVFTLSCTKPEPTPVFSKSESAFSIASSVTSVSVAAKDSLAEVASISWPDPEYVVGLSQSKFRIVVAPTGKGFVNFQTKEFTGVVKGALLGKEINAMALKFGGTIGQPVTLDVKVVASQSNNNEQKTSNVVQIAVTPYGDLALTPSVTSVVTSAATSSNVGVTLNWSNAFNGFTGVKMYQLQYAKGGTSFASPTSTDVTGLTKSFTQLDLNKIALGYGVAAGAAGAVDFRIKASNESGTVLYSNTTSISITTYVAFNSIGIIGDGTPGGWDIDTDMYRPDPINKPADWTVNLYLTGGKAAKFRADDDWASNWGSTGFPNGTGTQGGDNIPVTTSGYYKVNFNAGSGAYTFTPITTTVYASVGLIGAQSNWGSEIMNLTKDPGNNQIWTGTAILTAGELKFRANADWGFNWGAASATETTALSGNGVKDGPNIVVTAGTYYVYINVATGEYFFGKTDRNVAYTDIGVIGDATAGGWDSDTNLIRNPSNPFKWSGKLTLTGGKEAKFRANNDWGVNWGAASFPGGVATQNGDNVKVATTGTYQITFNSATGEYTFSK